MLSPIPSLQDDEEDVSYDVESLFTNTLIEETINYTITITRNNMGRKAPISSDLQKYVEKHCNGP